jgi:hypothetical protein
MAKPLSVAGGLSHGFSFQDLPTAPTISLIRFGRRAATTDFGTTFVSTVASGAVQLVDLEREVKLDRGAWVIIGYSVGFSGAARHVAIGPAGFAEDLTPTWLDYLYHQE